jgi:hypothetical protein
MGLEVATYINGLVVTNPTSLDPKSQGDDHLRLVKSVLKNTFPNIDGAVLVTEDQLNLLSNLSNFVPPGIITMWSGLIANIPSGWKLCDGVGTISNGNPVPDLRNRFVMGAGDEYDVGDEGGSVDHDHDITVEGHALTIDEIPSHTHGMGRSSVQSAVGNPTDRVVGPGAAVQTNPTGGGEEHDHDATADTASNLPPYFALAYIIKD